MTGYREASLAIEYLLDIEKKELTNKTEDVLSEYLKELNLAIEEFEIIKRYAFRDHTKQNSDLKILTIKSKIQEIEKIKKEVYGKVKVINNQTSNLTHPFKDDETFELFKYIVKKWQ